MILVAVLIRTVVPLIPHHHHHDTLCTTVEHCDLDDADNDEHTAHSGDDTHCIEDAKFLISKSETSHQPTVVSLLPILVATVNLSAGAASAVSGIRSCRHRAALLYQSADIGHFHTRRGPPSFSV